MRLISRIFGVLLTLVVIVVLAAGGAAAYLVRKDFPQIDGTLKAPGLRAPVDVIRDKYGVPHIYAQNDHDLLFAQGYVHAQDRFWQMEFWRRIGQGRLSEILGPSTLDTDRYLRTLGLRRAAVAEVAVLPPDEQSLLQAYADGVNAYLAANRGNLGLEFTLLGANGVRFDPEPWAPVDTLTWIKIMALDLGGNADTEVLRLRMIQALGPERTAALLAPAYPSGKPVILPGAQRYAGVSVAGLVADMQAYQSLAGGLGGLGAGSGGLGSNDWVVAASHTTTGRPILANDPHLGIRMPSIWYEVDLHCVALTPDCRYQVTGFSFAGVPGVILGHNQRIAWGFTNVGPDVQDLYVEDLQGDAVRFQGALVPLQTVEETILVDGQLPADYSPRSNESVSYDAASGRTTVRLTVRIVPHHGPLMSDADSSMAATGKALSLRWTALQPEQTADAIFLLNRAQNWDEFRAALAMFAVPSQNVVYADVDGHIGWQVPGLIPIRPAGCDGLVPAPGDGSCEWQGYVPYDSLPRSFDPPEGWIATANNAPVGPDFPFVLGREWDDGYRAQRIVELLTAKDKLSLDDMAAIQFDAKNVFAGEIIPLLADFAPADPRSAQALGILRQWDLQALRDSVGQTIFSSLYVHLLTDIYGDELGKELTPSYLASPEFNRQALRRTLGDPSAPWWDDVNTPEKETRAQTLERVFKDTVDELTATLGPDMAGWTWGKVHMATFANESLGQSDALGGLLKVLLNRGPFPVSGGTAIVDATSWSAARPYTVVSVPSMRAIYDLGDLANSRVVHTTGQSGHPYNAHYDDFISLWASGQYHPELWERSAVESAAEGHLVLTP